MICVGWGEDETADEASDGGLGPESSLLEASTTSTSHSSTLQALARRVERSKKKIYSMEEVVAQQRAARRANVERRRGLLSTSTLMKLRKANFPPRAFLQKKNDKDLLLEEELDAAVLAVEERKKLEAELEAEERKLSDAVRKAAGKHGKNAAGKTSKASKPKTPFWTIRNSWGKDWAERGYVRMLRGSNYAAMEYQAEYAVPDLDRLDLSAFGIEV